MTRDTEPDQMAKIPNDTEYGYVLETNKHQDMLLSQQNPLDHTWLTHQKDRFAKTEHMSLQYQVHINQAVTRRARQASLVI